LFLPDAVELESWTVAVDERADHVESLQIHILR